MRAKERWCEVEREDGQRIVAPHLAKAMRIDQQGVNIIHQLAKGSRRDLQYQTEQADESIEWMKRETNTYSAFELHREGRVKLRKLSLRVISLNAVRSAQAQRQHARTLQRRSEC